MCSEYYFDRELFLSKIYHTCLAPFYLALELSLLLRLVQNQNLPSRGPKCPAHLAHSASSALCNQENTLDIALDTFRSLVSFCEVRECVTQTLQILQISRDPQTRVISVLWGLGKWRDFERGKL